MPSWLRLPLIAYLAFCLLLSMFQERLIFPGAYLGEHAVPAAPNADAIQLTTADGEAIDALFAAAQSADGSPLADAAERPTLLFFYGNGMTLGGSTDLLADFRRLGANVMMVEYVGYGRSAGSPSERGCYASADAAYKWLRESKAIDARQIILVGWSLGGGVAIDLAARREVGGLVVLSSFTSLLDVSKLHYPWLPVGLLLRHRFDNLAKLPLVRCPVVIGHGESDDLVPASMSKKLTAAVPSALLVDHFVAADVGHVDMFDAGWNYVDHSLRKLIDLAGSAAAQDDAL